MKSILQITALLVMVWLVESFVPKVLVNQPAPCAAVTCITGTKCVIRFGRAICLPEDICSLPPESGLCRAYFVRYFFNTTYGKCEEFVYGGCGGNKNNFKTKKECETQCGSSALCPPDKPMHHCIIRPCLLEKCPAYPGAKCVNNYCGGCKADFYVDDKEVDCRVVPCRPPSVTHQCKVAPCHVNKCPAYPKAHCVNNYCGGCFADFYIKDKKVDCNKVPNPCDKINCWSGTKCIVKFGFPLCMAVNPCSTVKCKAGTRCVVRYYYFQRKPVCVPVKSPCTYTFCRVGRKCVVRDGKAVCQQKCKTRRDCTQQGSFCDTASGLCECQNVCPLVVTLPVCGSDGKQYNGGKCQLDAAACEKKTTIFTVPCKDFSS